MIIYKKYLVVFGGFHDNLRSCKYFNDTFIFNLETNQWQELKFSLNELPSPRSACQLVLSTKNNAVIVYGGFSKEKLKKDKEKGVVHTDMFALSLESMSLVTVCFILLL
jgi:N-acetylneuraminic acid mutarotase